MNSEYENTFPVVRGIQAGRPCYIAMCPMRLIPRLFIFNEDQVPPELRAQRTINTARVPEISNYLVDNSRDYTLSSITASINTKVTFEPLSDTGHGQNMGVLKVPMDAQILINDGQHRRKAIEEAIKENPELGHDHISVLFFIDEGLVRSQQMFADLNKHAVRPSDSISTLYDHRDAVADLARFVQKKVRIFSRLTELEKSSISNRSTKLFTLSAIKNATKALLSVAKNQPIEQSQKELAAEYWNEVAANMPDWQEALNKTVATSHLREQYVHAHGVMLQAMGNIGADLLTMPKTKWKKALKKLAKIDWSRANVDWADRAMNHGTISKARNNVFLTGNYIKQSIGVSLNPTEKEVEKQYKR
ncbi:DNA sulfur modification protein DndB [Aliikangiella sp. IMCC44359]|uniref:DNA sulfur modification protein DndB n=1 Tax=Aliikangiella sp. IMCC44359 TaxID=3459125 RepID=UPI00403AFB1E